MEKRVILALVLSLLVLFFYQEVAVRWIAPPPVKKASADKNAPEQAKKSESVSAAPVKEEGPASTIKYTEETATVETPLYKAVFSGKGGGIKSWVLKNYKEGLGQTSSNVEMAASGLDEYPLEERLIKGAASVRQAHDEVAYFKPSRTIISLNPGQKQELVFTWQSPDGVRIEKKYVISADAYGIQAETTISNASSNPFEGKMSTGLVSSVKLLEKKGGSYHKGPIFYSDGGILTKDMEQGEEIKTGKLGWAGLEEMYFISAIIPKKAEDAKWSSVITGDLVKVEAVIPVNLPPNGNANISYAVYIGPKDMGILKAQGVHLEDSIDYG